MKLRCVVWAQIVHTIGYGSKTFLWWDCWHPHGPLIKVHGWRSLYEPGLSSAAKVSNVIADGDRKWPSPRSVAMHTLKVHFVV